MLFKQSTGRATPPYSRYRRLVKVLPFSLALLLYACGLGGCQVATEEKRGVDHIHRALKQHRYHSAVRRAKSMARKGHAKGQTILGLLYRYGVGLEKDVSSAVYWFEKAAEQGEANAENELGHLFLGKDGPRDIKRAEHWLSKAAEHGVRDAQLHLGLMYLNGDGVEKNAKRASFLLRKAALQGSDEARETIEKVPGVKDAETTVTKTVSKSGKYYSNGLYNMRDSWEGYADVVTSVRAAASAASNAH